MTHNTRMWPIPTQSLHFHRALPLGGPFSLTLLLSGKTKSQWRLTFRVLRATRQLPYLIVEHRIRSWKTAHLLFVCQVLTIWHRYAPTDICNAIYGGVQGAHYDADQGQWIVPCDAEIDMALQIKSVLINWASVSIFSQILHTVTKSILFTR